MLRTVCAPVETITDEIKVLADALIELMRYHKGVGLAAPQVGQTIRMAAITQWDMSQEQWELLVETVIINPKIL
ncbi:MAG: peptide deformylase [Candidatus Peribacteria bacterium]|nr:MAG: peptide deformylase [Candidatus Peribacteria bacterium]